jgi:hypothetical protein
MARYVVQPFDERYEISLHAIYTHVMKDRLKYNKNDLFIYNIMFLIIF